MTKPNFDKSETCGSIKLPLSSRGEDLETISRNKLSLLFDTRYFEIRHELQRGFTVQLKSTGSVRVNRNSSISYPIEVSNINYSVILLLLIFCN